MSKLVCSNGYINNVRGIRIFHQRWCAATPSASVILVHGVGEHSGRYREFAEYLVSQNISVYAFDLEGFGKSDGKRGHIDYFSYYAQDLKSFIDYIVSETEGKQSLYLLGHSLGAIVCLETLHIYDDLNLAGLIVSGPPFRLNLSTAEWFRKFGSIFSSFLPALTFEEKSIQINMLTHDEGKKEEFLRDPLRHYQRSFKLIREFFKAERKAFYYSSIVNIPLLVVQGGEDTIINVKRVEEFYHSVLFEDKMLIIYPEMYHEVLNEIDRERVYGDILRWIKNHC